MILKNQLFTATVPGHIVCKSLLVFYHWHIKQEKKLDGSVFRVPLFEPALAADWVFFPLRVGSPVFVFSLSGLIGVDALDVLPCWHQSLLGGPHLFVHVGMTRDK